MVATLLCTLWALQSGNLLANPNLNDHEPGWGALYLREPGSGEANFGAVDNIGPVVHVEHRGQQDWSFYQTETVPVHPEDVFELSANLKTEGSENVDVSVVTLDSNGQTLDWSYAPLRVIGAHDWQRLKHRFVVPAKCSAIRFRLNGYGPGTTYMANPGLFHRGTLSSFKGTAATSVTLERAGFHVRIGGDGGISATFKGKPAWSAEPPGLELFFKTLTKRDPSHVDFELASIENDAVVPGTITLDPTRPEVVVELRGQGPMPSELVFPGPLATEPGERLIVPMNEGIQFPVDDPATPALDLVTFSGHGICMPWFGIENVSNGSGAMAIFETPDDALLRLNRSDKNLSRPSTVWLPSRHEFRYARRVRLAYLPQGGYVGMAKRYRAYAKAHGLLVTLKQKATTNPYVDRLIGAMNVWNWDMNPVEIGRSMKALGMDRILWSRGGQPEELKALNDLGFLTSRYDIYQDVYDPKIALSWMNTAGWPEDLVWQEDGTWMKGWAHPDHKSDGTIHWIQGGVISSGAGLKRAEQLIPAELKTHPYHCRFLDTTTASPWREDYNPAHPLTRSDDRKNKMALLAFCSQTEGLVVGSETGLDASVPYLEYFEGMESLGPYRLPDSGTDMMAYRKPTADFLKFQVGSFYRLPLWELVYHDCTVAQWYWGDATNKAPEVWDQRDLLNLLYGTAPLVMFDQAKWKAESARIAQTYRTVCAWGRQIGYEEMVSHAYLSADHTVQRSTFASGRSVTVNFGKTPWHGIAPMGYQLSHP